jgi:hypothetical protein
MVDSGIKKIKISQKDLPPINSEIEGYSVRYRVVSEDKNRTSQWSPIVQINPGYTHSAGEIVFNKTGSIAQLAWDAVTILKDGNVIRKASEYDVWVKWDRNDNGDWIYKERITGTSVSFPIPTTYKINGVVQASLPNKLSTEIYLKGNPVSRDSSFLLVYDDGPQTV